MDEIQMYTKDVPIRKLDTAICLDTGKTGCIQGLAAWKDFMDPRVPVLPISSNVSFTKTRMSRGRKAQYHASSISGIAVTSACPDLVLP